MTMTGEGKKRQKLVGEGLFKIPESSAVTPHLIGSRCLDCGEVVFPRKTLCPNCCSGRVEESFIGSRGKLYSFTVIYQLGPLGYKGPVPYGVAKVEMPEGLRITGYSSENDPSKLHIGMDMEIVIEKLYDDDDGTPVVGFKFKPL